MGIDIRDGDIEVLSLGSRRASAAELAALDERGYVVVPARFQVGHVDLRDPNPGHGEQRHHPDHGETPVPGLTVTRFLDSFTAENGATRVLAAGRNTTMRRRRSALVFYQHVIPEPA